MAIMWKITDFFSLEIRNPFKCIRDVHSHILPGIDDGVDDMDECLQVLSNLFNLGYRKIVATPHVISSVYNNSSTEILEQVSIVNLMLEQHSIGMQIDAGAEYYLDSNFKKLLENRDILAIDNKYLLFETSHIAKPLNLKQMIFFMLEQGYTPLMAHPERYQYFKNDLDFFVELKNIGVLFQSNIRSFCGSYGKIAKENVILLAEASLIDFIGTDIHSLGQFKYIQKVFECKKFINLMSKNNLLN